MRILLLQTGSRMIELSEDSMGRSPLFIYCSGDRSYRHRPTLKLLR
jgi:hypothetical protein